MVKRTRPRLDSPYHPHRILSTLSSCTSGLLSPALGTVRPSLDPIAVVVYYILRSSRYRSRCIHFYEYNKTLVEADTRTTDNEQWKPYDRRPTPSRVKVDA
jgi:hypothetical protein